jgi:hypothetical protein
MNTGRYRAWRFLIPELDVPSDEDAGLRLSPTGGMAMVEEDASVRQAVLLLLSTAPGERVMRPSYGCDLNRLIFSPNDQTTAGLAIHFVSQALSRWEPRIQLLRLDAGSSPESPHVLDIHLQYRVRATHATTELVWPVVLSGEAR